MPLQHMEDLPRRDIPDPGRLVLAASNEPLAVGCERQVFDPVFVADEMLNLDNPFRLIVVGDRHYWRRLLRPKGNRTGRNQGGRG